MLSTAARSRRYFPGPRTCIEDREWVNHEHERLLVCFCGRSLSDLASEVNLGACNSWLISTYLIDYKANEACCQLRKKGYGSQSSLPGCDEGQGPARGGSQLPHRKQELAVISYSAKRPA